MVFRKLHIDITSPYDLLWLGVTGENYATRLIIDVSAVVALYPNARISILMQRGKEMPYPAAVALLPDNGIVQYEVTAVDTSVPGRLNMEIQALQDDVVIKSLPMGFEVSSGVRKSGINPGEAVAQWEDLLIRLANEVAIGTEGLSRFVGLLQGMKINTVTLPAASDVTLDWTIEDGQLIVDIGMPTSVFDGDISHVLDQHNADENAHQNMRIDGGLLNTG